jgi:hypothetical protein
MKPRKMTGKGRGVGMPKSGMPKPNKSGGASMPSKGGR